MGLLALTPATATFLGALVGAAAGCAVAVFTARAQLRLERERSDSSREDAATKELSSAVQQLVIKMSSALHSMCWLTWFAHYRGARLEQKMIDNYDSEMHMVTPEILGHLSTVAALDDANDEKGVYRKLSEYTDEIFRLDAQIGAASLNLKKNKIGTAKTLASYHKAMFNLERKLPDVIGHLVGDRIRNPAGPITRTSAPPRIGGAGTP